MNEMIQLRARRLLGIYQEKKLTQENVNTSYR